MKHTCPRKLSLKCNLFPTKNNKSNTSIGFRNKLNLVIKVLFEVTSFNSLLVNWRSYFSVCIEATEKNTDQISFTFC